MPTIAQIKAANAKVTPAKPVQAKPDATPLSVHAAVVLGAVPAFAVYKGKQAVIGTKTFMDNVRESYKFYNRELNS